MNKFSRLSLPPPPPRPPQQPQQLQLQLHHHHHDQQQQQQPQQSSVSKPSLFTSRQQDKLKGWLHTVRKKTARLSTRITASLGLISLTRDEEFEKHHESFKHIEKTIRVFIKNLTTFVEHFENFLLALQNTSENLADFYRDKTHQRELEELRRKNKALACEHFHAFKRTVDRHVVSVASQLLQKFSSPHQLISKRSAKLIDYDIKTKEMESCRDLEKKATLSDQYVIAKELYDRINRQLIEELPTFNQFAIDIFRECILVLLESRKNLISAYTNQTASLLDTPLMMTYTATDAAFNILMSCELVKDFKQTTDINEVFEQERKDSGETSGHDTRHNSANDDDQLSTEFVNMAIAAREISSTPLSQVSDIKPSDISMRFVEHDELKFDNPNGVRFDGHDRAVKFDEPDGGLDSSMCGTDARLDSDRHSTPLPQPERPAEDTDADARPVRKEPPKERKKKKFPIYYASWPFVATGPNQLTIAYKQPLKLIKSCDECGNSDWSLVQDKKGQLGYVPSSYIEKKE